MKTTIFTDQAYFANIRQQNGRYIDKTKQIYDCLGTGKYFFLARPRRFGKSLLCNTLKELFAGRKELFKGLWIENSDWKWAQHPVIKLDMTDMAGSGNTKDIFTQLISRQLHNVSALYDLKIEEPTPASLLAALVKALHGKTGLGVVIIIDEYDKPILDLVNNPAVRQEVHAALRDFYSPLKSLEPYLRLVFMTGVYKFTQTSIFSNLNNLTDLTFSYKAGSIVGYTEEELTTNFSDEIDQLAAKIKKNRPQMIEILRDQYNGYHFGVDVDTGELSDGVYNSFAMNHVFASLQLVKNWFASGSPRFLIEKIRDGHFELITPKGLLANLSTIQISSSPDDISALSLLYYAGYATLGQYFPDREKIRLVYPNLEVSQATAQELLKIFRNHEGGTLYDFAWDISDCFRLNKFDDLKELFNQALAQLTHQIIVSEEKYFQTVVLLILQMGKLQAQAEIPTNDGRMDIVVTVPGAIFILELKFNKPAADGLQQIKDKDYAKKFRSQGLPLTAVGMSIALGQVEKNKCVFDVAVEKIY